MFYNMNCFPSSSVSAQAAIQVTSQADATSAQALATSVQNLLSGGTTGTGLLRADGLQGMGIIRGRPRHVDMLFMLDGSASVTTEGFEEAKNTAVVSHAYEVIIIMVMMIINENN